jgi:hypothetical protein
LFGGTLSVTTVESTQQYVVSSGVDYALFKLFQMSVLWRAGVASYEFFSQVVLGRHEKILRNMLRNEDPGKWYQYACAMMMPILGSTDTVDLIRSPDRLDCDHHLCFRFLMGGFVWFYVVSDQPSEHALAGLALQEDGRLTFLKTDARRLRFLLGDAHDMAKRSDDVANLIRKRPRHRG